MGNNRCLYCYDEIDGGKDYHEKCSISFFGTSEPPVLDYNLDQMHELAKKVIAQSVTVPGVQAKISLRLNKDTAQKHRLTLIGVLGDFILKPPVAHYPELPENEDLTMHLADKMGIKTVPHALIRFRTGELAYITKRIDRDAGGEKIHMEDLCQLSEKLTENKYRGSLERVAKTIYQFSSNPLLDMVELFNLVLFTFLTGNADMHLKNFSMYNTQNGMIVLTPAYDLLSTRLVIPGHMDNEESALTMNGNKRNFRKNDFRNFATHIGLTDKQAENSFKIVQEKLNPMYRFIEKSFLSIEKKQLYQELLLARAKRIA